MSSFHRGTAMQLPSRVGRLRGMHRSGRLLLALALVAVAHLWIPRPAVACSCVPPLDSLEMAAGDVTATIFAATTGPTVGDQMQVVVTRWFRGQSIGGVAAVQINLGDGASCGMSPLPAGHGYLFMTYPSETSPHALSLCSPQGDLATPDGQALLARAVQLYGAGAAPPGDSTPATVAPSAGYGDPTVIGLITSVVAGLAPLALVIAFALGLLGGVALILRRRTRLDD